MTNKTSEQTALESAQEALEKTNSEKYPKLYKTREELVKSLEYAQNQKIRAEKAEKSAKSTPKKAEGENPTPKKKDGFDYAELAYLEVKGVNDKEAQDYLSSEIKKTGKDLKELLGYDYINESLKKMKEAKESQNAIPSRSKRSSATVKSDVSYWINKGELPENTPENMQLRREIVNAKLKKSENVDKFTENPIIQ
jgi:hypothetical protein